MCPAGSNCPAPWIVEKCAAGFMCPWGSFNGGLQCPNVTELYPKLSWGLTLYCEPGRVDAVRPEQLGLCP